MKRAKMSDDLEVLEDELMAELLCYSCKGVPGPSTIRRYKCIEEGHSLCHDCKSSKPECPCGSRICPKHCKSTEILIRTLKIPWYCCHYQHGCRRMFRDETALNEHQADCSHRKIHCCYPDCNKEVLFKDFLDHYKQEFGSKIVKAKNFSPTHLVPYLARPLRIEAHGNTFFLVGKIHDDQCRMWMLMMSSSADVLKNFQCTLKVNDGKRDIISRGEPFPIDKHFIEILDDEEGFSIGIRKALEIHERLGKFKIEIEIRNLEEEAKPRRTRNKDMESEVSSD